LCLGRKLEKNLKKNSNDEISVWMAHYIAEKMITIESAGIKEKVTLQKECFEAILTLWNYQSSFPYDMRPFKEFDSIFKAIDHIDPNKSTPSYFRDENPERQPPEEIKTAISFITNLDAATRTMISFFVRESILRVTNKSTLDWLDAIRDVVKSNEADVILKFAPELDVKNISHNKKEKRKKECADNIKKLEAFEALSREVKSALEFELEHL